MLKNDKAGFVLPDTDLASILEFVPGYVYWKNLDSVYLGCNQNFAVLIGLRIRNEIIGKTDYELVDSAIASKYISDDQYVIKTGKQLIAEDRTGIKNSKGLEVILRTEKKPFLDKEGNVIGTLGISVDITDEVDLRNSEIDQSLILNSTPGYVYWKNLDSVYLGCNQDFLKVALMDDINSVIGKTDHDLSWGAEPEIVAKYLQDDKYVISTGKTIVTEENVVVKNSRGLTVIARTEKKPLYNKRGNIIGVLCTSVDITDQKEAERLRLQEKEKLISLAHKVAHDISSPLSALNMMMQFCDELPESKRSLIKRATESILDIANNLLNTYRNEEQRKDMGIEQRQSVLISDLIIQLMSEKKVQYRNHPVTFHTEIAGDAYFAFAHIQATEFRRTLSNLINNSVDASEENQHGLISIQLKVDESVIAVGVQDNGKGMPHAMLEKMQHRRSFTEGKENGHGLGLQQVWDTLDHNEGTLEVQSALNKGTLIKLTFPRTKVANWIAKEIHLTPDSIIVILDDDESIHTAWDLRFSTLLISHPGLRLHHFTQGQEALDFLTMLTPEPKDHVLFLSDYELLQQDRNGLEIIEASQVKGAILVTSYYSNPKVREAAIAANVKILPKQMASIISIDFTEI